MSKLKTEFKHIKMKLVNWLTLYTFMLRVSIKLPLLSLVATDTDDLEIKMNASF